MRLYPEVLWCSHSFKKKKGFFIFVVLNHIYLRVSLYECVHLRVGIMDIRGPEYPWC